MRTEQQMLDLILDTARCDERIRAVIMNGSRANPNAPHDPFQDFDIVYIVTDVSSFRHDHEWIRRFGDLMIMQLPEDMQDPPAGDDESFAYLMQFMDGNRIDLGIFTLSQWKQRGGDSLSVLLFDKDGIIEPFPPASEADYLPQPPTAKAFADCCNEFWWVAPYVAKGLWRQEILYAKCIHDEVVRGAELMKMMKWHIGVRTDFKINPGKLGKYFQSYLEPELWESLLKTFANASYEDTWDALLATCNLFRKVAIPIAKHFGFEYPFEEDRRVTAHLEYVRALPRDAKEMYP
ncbi:MAG TPA: aminoglycoside 6-adenylyltransferase [Anaerolineales bacterium]|nr:aminoglycoside 6-adenylyltransferase [Anaerolineales bacterium]